MIRHDAKHTFGSLVVGSLLNACAVPATQVSVSTESMHDALQQARTTSRAEAAGEVSLHRPVHSAAPPGAPQPILAPPDVRMVYLYPWIDAEGNKHFGGWVAVPLAGFDWVMDDGSNPHLDPHSIESAGSEPPR